MLKGLITVSATALLFGAAFATAAHAADAFEAGTHYFAVEPPQPTTTGDKVEVVEVFSYACPACNMFQPTMQKLKAALPANAELVYLPASFRPDEDWPVFQRTFYTAQALGVLDKTHDATFDLVWKDDGPLRISDAKTHRPVSPMPTIDDVAKAYGAFGVKADEFTATANSFAVNTRMKRADAMLKAYGVDSTPTLVVNGKYRLTAASAGGIDKVVPLVKYLIEKDGGAK
ncbi:MAG TPA: thiol:disulfide interchange protein DsbA/DsbL [Dokdonella sp.]|nr:thiol:disulfide interchange protein DsbA/DsbL [Dokdonella sp.]